MKQIEEGREENGESRNLYRAPQCLEMRTRKGKREDKANPTTPLSSKAQNSPNMELFLLHECLIHTIPEEFINLYKRILP